MERDNPTRFFDEKAASGYDQQWAKLAPLREALNLLMAAVLGDLPPDGRLLCVGAGTGSEVLYLAERFPGWRFTVVEPSPPMLEVCRSRVEAAGLASRCTLVEGYVEELEIASPFHAATSLLVSQFLLDRAARVGFFRAIAERLQPGGVLISADLSADIQTPEYQSLLEVWLRVMTAADVSPEQVERIRAVYSRDVAVLPPSEVESIITEGGFDLPVRFCQTGLIHAWYARR